MTVLKGIYNVSIMTSNDAPNIQRWSADDPHELTSGEKIVHVNSVDLCVETFGNPTDPPILLLAGGILPTADSRTTLRHSLRLPRLGEIHNL
jgi:hypothetical protein